MKSATLIVLFSVLTFSTFAQDDNYLVAVWDTITGECGFVDKSGEYVIPTRTYPVILTDTFRTFAIVYKSNRGFVGINRNEEVIFQLVQHGQEPDFPSEGIFRIIENDKIGYADINGKIIIEPVFDIAYPFREGLAVFCEDCKAVKTDNATHLNQGKWGYVNKEGEIVIAAKYDKAHSFKEGLAAFCEGCNAKSSTKAKWGFIDKEGNVVIPPTYNKIKTGFRDGVAKVRLDKEWIKIDTEGNVIPKPTDN